MSATKEIQLGPYNVGSTERLRVTITKDEVAWNSIDSVTLILENPDRETQTSYAMTLESGNIWYYDTTTNDLDTVGYWTAQVRVVDGSITKRYPYEIGFYVQDGP